MSDEKKGVSECRFSPAPAPFKNLSGKDRERVRDRLRGALWGCFVGDALAMPVHWYYDVNNLKRDYGHVQEYVAPKNPHPESMIGGMAYEPDPNSDRPKLVMQRHELYLKQRKQELKSDDAEYDDTHGNQLKDKPSERVHYHDGLHVGENTINPQVVRVLLRHVGAYKAYSGDKFLQQMITFFTTEGTHNDAYFDVWIRRFFEKFSTGADLNDCACRQRDVWSIGHSGGCLGGIAVGLMYLSHPVDSVSQATLHHQLTHRSINVTMAMQILLPLLRALIVDGEDAEKSILEAASRTRIPKISGADLLQSYRDHKGPGNIPKDLMWRYHTELRDEPFDPTAWLNKEDNEVVGSLLTSACYTEHSVPATLYLALKYKDSFEKPLIASTNAGGDNCGRTSLVGYVSGAIHGESGIPEKFLKGLYNYKEINAEITAFVDFVCPAE